MIYVSGASLTHRLLNHLVQEFPNPSGDVQSPSTANFPYRIDHCDLHMMYNQSITACTPDTTKHDSCLGDDQLLLSTILSADPHFDAWQMGMWTDIIKSVFNGKKAKNIHDQLEGKLKMINESGKETRDLFCEEGFKNLCLWKNMTVLGALLIITCT